jgi:ArsR family transcriptional regulator
MNMRSYKCCSVSKTNHTVNKELTALIKLLSVNNRLQLLNILRSGEHCVCQFADHLELSQSLISHHLRDLKDFGLVTHRRDSKWSYYSLTPKGVSVTSSIFKIKI